MFGKKKKENNKDSVVWCPPNESEVVDQSKMINSLAVFANIESPNYNKSEKKPEIVEYNANEKTVFHIITARNLKLIDTINKNKEESAIIDLQSFEEIINPLVKKIVIDLESKPELLSYNMKVQLLLQKERFVVYGIPFNNFNEDIGEIFDLTILILSECKNKTVKKVIKFDIDPFTIRYPLNTFYKNPYFLSSVFSFIRSKTTEDLASEIFEGLGLFDNEIKL